MGCSAFGTSTTDAVSWGLPPREKEQGIAELATKFDKAYEGKSIEELAAAPVWALQGVSDSDAQNLQAAFGITTVKDLGTNKSPLGPGNRETRRIA